MSANRRRVVHGPECTCATCLAHYHPQAGAAPPELPPLPPMPAWDYALSYALVQVGNFFKVLTVRYAVQAPAPAAPAEGAAQAEGDDEAEVARRAAAGDYQ